MDAPVAFDVVVVVGIRAAAGPFGSPPGRRCFLARASLCRAPCPVCPSRDRRAVASATRDHPARAGVRARRALMPAASDGESAGAASTASRNRSPGIRHSTASVARDGGRPGHRSTRPISPQVVGSGHLVDPTRARAVVVVDHQASPRPARYRSSAGSPWRSTAAPAGRRRSSIAAASRSSAGGVAPSSSRRRSSTATRGASARAPRCVSASRSRSNVSDPAARTTGHQTASATAAGRPQAVDQRRRRERPHERAHGGQRQDEPRDPAEDVTGDAALQRRLHQDVEGDDRDALQHQDGVGQQRLTQHRQRRERDAGQQHEHGDHQPGTLHAGQPGADDGADHPADAGGGEQPAEPAGAGAQELGADQHEQRPARRRRRRCRRPGSRRAPAPRGCRPASPGPPAGPPPCPGRSPGAASRRDRVRMDSSRAAEAAKVAALMPNARAGSPSSSSSAAGGRSGDEGQLVDRAEQRVRRRQLVVGHDGPDHR